MLVDGDQLQQQSTVVGTEAIEDGAMDQQEPSQPSDPALMVPEDEQQLASLPELTAYIEDLQQKDAQRRHFREQNSPEATRMLATQLSKLDSNIKKSAAFVRKIRNLTESAKDGLLKDINQLNLSKYLSEITAALVELKLKSSELPIYIEICTELHRRYAEFNDLLLEQWTKTFPKTLPEISNYSKLRTDIRLFAELISCGVFPVRIALGVLGNLLRLLLSERDSINLNVILHFCKHCGWDYAGLTNRQMCLAAEHHKLQLPVSSFLPPDKQKNLRGLLGDYYRQLISLLEKDYKTLQTKERQNKQILVTKGEISEARKKTYEETRINFNKFMQSVQQLADLLDEDMPKLEKDIAELEEISIDCFNESKLNVGEIPLWEDEWIRNFYEQIPNLKQLISAHLYKESIKEKYYKGSKKPDVKSVIGIVTEKDREEKGLGSVFDKPAHSSDTKQQQQQPEDKEKSAAQGGEPKFSADAKTDDKSETVAESGEQLLAEKMSRELVNEDSDDEQGLDKELSNLQIDNKDNNDDGKKGQMNKDADTKGRLVPKEDERITFDEFSTSLLNCLNAEAADKAAINFSLYLNSKANRRKLLRALFTPPRNRLDLLPFYARFTAIVTPIMPLIGSDLVELLKKDFRFHFMKKDQIHVEQKIVNVRFIGELTKFSIFPKVDAVNCLKHLLLDFAHHQIEMACNLLDVCGRYLFLQPETHHKCHLLLQQMMRKKALITNQSKYVSMIENSYYNSCPTVGSSNAAQAGADNQRQASEDSNISKPHLYCRYLIHTLLGTQQKEHVLKLLKELPYDNKEIAEYVEQSFTQVWRAKYNNIYIVARCLFKLSKRQPSIAVHVVDNVLEDIRLMLEINNIKYNQRRVAMIKYLGDLCCLGLVDTHVIIDTLYLLINYGINQGYEPFFEEWKVRLKHHASNQAVQTAESSAANHYQSAQQQQQQKGNDEFDLNASNRKLVEFGISKLDEADNLFRIRLVSTLLETTATFFMRDLQGKQRNACKKKLTCFIYFFQLYYERKKALPIYENAPFPMDAEFLFTDSVRKILPKFKFARNFGKAYLDLQTMLNDLAPSVIELLPKNDKSEPATSSSNGGNLDAIAEHDEDEDAEEDGDDDAELDDDEDAQSMTPSDEDDEQADEYNSDPVSADDAPKSLPIVQDEEDDEFQREFDRMITESLANRSSENVRNITAEIVIPVSKLDNLTKSKAPASSSSGSGGGGGDLFANANGSGDSAQVNNTFNVILMTKAKNKPMLRKIEVPLDSELAINLKEKERAEKEEKEMVKKLTLDINERREMEEEILERNANGSIVMNLNRDRRKYNHLKGVPDADLIFGSNKRR